MEPVADVRVNNVVSDQGDIDELLHSTAFRR